MSDQIDADIAKVQADEAALTKDTAQLAADKAAVVPVPPPPPPAPTFPALWCGHAWVNFLK